jgi:hypothetical protein
MIRDLPPIDLPYRFSVSIFMAIVPSKSPPAEDAAEGDEAVELFVGCAVLVQEAASSAMHRSAIDRNPFNVRLVLGRNISVLPFLSICSSDGVINLGHHNQNCLFRQVFERGLSQFVGQEGKFRLLPVRAVARNCPFRFENSFMRFKASFSETVARRGR